MINDTQNQNVEQESSEANRLGQSRRGAKLKEYGKEAYGPLVNIIYKYQDEITPFFASLEKALEGAISALSDEESTEADRMIGDWISDARQSLTEGKDRIQGKDKSEIISFVEDQARQKPALAFASSYVVGLFLGRIGRHIGRKGFSQNSSGFQSTEQSPHH